MPPKRPLSPPQSNSSSSSFSSAPSNLASSALYVSKTLEDRASTFTAYFSPTAPSRQLQSHPDLATASHRILAWRKPSASQKTLTGLPTFSTGSDDDGENFAGKKLLRLLDDYKVEGSLVVARWYGGKMLGPVRFQHIEAVAKEAIRAYLADKSGGGSGADGESAKKVKVSAEDEKKQKEELIEELRNRDESIVVLRDLLDQKMGKTRNDGEAVKSSQTGDGTVKTKTIDYASLPLERLKQLDKARDNTVAFLLKKIDQVENQQSSSSEKKSKASDSSNDKPESIKQG
ncbi:hypothetical protein TWF694_007902 [Orbilia ellipsospora]|uniref:Impact N-terminal domain-containing protein n=1 Tax=Orbilia ellipsospora TaxID=2528407 RepID=A0AAV9XJ32_9PEZI